eukprot:jgi/Psemu1/241975/estExt_Genewise1.C_2560025
MTKWSHTRRHTRSMVYTVTAASAQFFFVGVSLVGFGFLWIDTSRHRFVYLDRENGRLLWRQKSWRKRGSFINIFLQHHCKLLSSQTK